jgi:hypothetical protein
VASAFFCHPADADWQYQIVDAWALSNPAQLKRAESKTDLGETQQKAIEELRRIHLQLTEDSTRFLNYIFNSPDQQPSDLLDYAERAFMALVAETSWWKAIQNFVKQ